MPAELVSLNVAQPAPLAFRGGTIPSAIRKQPAAGPLRLAPTGLAGDAQANLLVHGGPDKAVCVYPTEHLPYWGERLGRRLAPAAFGENFSTVGLLEDEVCIGDVYRVGTALVQVTQPRQPCYKLATHNGEPAFALWVQESGWTGFYFRCLEAGDVQASNAITLVERPAPGCTIVETNRLLHRDKYERAGIERLLARPELAAGLRRNLGERLAGVPDNPRRRLEGLEVVVEVG
ncbi:MAG TPA: MOSC domain-containing protein [Chloroflexota bacterium]|jgi:MOSC domain-containing protein YiiM